MLRSSGLLVCIVLLALSTLGSTLNENDACTNPSGQSGWCIYYQKCEPLMKMYNKSIISPTERKFITESVCGEIAGKFLVCCALHKLMSSGISGRYSLPKPPNCGGDYTNRIFGGQKTSLDEFPWTALLMKRYAEKLEMICGATLINTRYVLTTAHCTKNTGIVTVRLGEWDINTPIDCEDQDYCADAPVDMDIERIIVHEDYKITGPYKYFNDIALIRFTRNVTFSPFISPICLPIESAQQNLNLTGTKGTATGWGLNDQETYGHVKQKVMLQIHDLQTCIDKYKSTRLTPKDTQLCAGGVPGQDTCRGDSGGPLTKLVRANHFLYGIVSMGSGCGSTIPGLYTNVVKYIDWIERNIH